jgi:hypothetical protein
MPEPLLENKLNAEVELLRALHEKTMLESSLLRSQKAEASRPHAGRRVLTVILSTATATAVVTSVVMNVFDAQKKRQEVAADVERLQNQKNGLAEDIKNLGTLHNAEKYKLEHEDLVGRYNSLKEDIRQLEDEKRRLLPASEASRLREQADKVPGLQASIDKLKASLDSASRAIDSLRFGYWAFELARSKWDMATSTSPNETVVMAFSLDKSLSYTTQGLSHSGSWEVSTSSLTISLADGSTVIYDLMLPQLAGNRLEGHGGPSGSPRNVTLTRKTP